MSDLFTNECDELYHDLINGGLSQICKLPRRHIGAHSHIPQITITTNDGLPQLSNQDIMKDFLASILTNPNDPPEPQIDLATPPIFMHGG